MQARTAKRAAAERFQTAHVHIQRRQVCILERGRGDYAHRFVAEIDGKAVYAAVFKRGRADFKFKCQACGRFKLHAFEIFTVLKRFRAHFRRANGHRIFQARTAVEHTRADCRELTRSYFRQARTARKHVATAHMQARQIELCKGSTAVERHIVRRTNAGHIDDFRKRRTADERLIGNRRRLDVRQVDLFEIFTVIERALIDHRQIRPVDIRVFLFHAVFVRYTALRGYEIHFFERATIFKRRFLDLGDGRGNDDTTDIVVILERVFADIHDVHVRRNHQNVRAQSRVAFVIPNAVIIDKRIVGNVEFFYYTQRYTARIQRFFAVTVNDRGNLRRTLFERRNATRFVYGRHRRIIRFVYDRKVGHRMIPRI